MPYRLAALLGCSFLLASAADGLALPSCGDANGAGGITAADALIALRKAVGQDVTCPACACDVNSDHAVSGSDALAALRRAVGQGRYLSCLHDDSCDTPQPHLTGLENASVAPAGLVTANVSGLEAEAPAFLRIFHDVWSIEVPAVAIDPGHVAAAAPPRANGQPAPGARVQVLQGAPLAASNVSEGLDIAAAPDPPAPSGKVTADFLLGAVEHADALLEDLPAESEMASTVQAFRNQLAELLADVEALRDLEVDSLPLGVRDGSALVLTRDHLAQVDAMILASLQAQSELPDAEAAMTSRSSQEGSSCRQQESAAYINALLHEPQTVTERGQYYSAPCAAEAARTSYAVILAPAALAVGIVALTGVTVTGIGLALPAAAVLYVSMAGAGGLIAVGGAMKETSEEGVALVKEGVALAESTMQQLVLGQVLPGVTGTLYDMGSALKDLSEAFASFTPVTPPTGCYCCCAYWQGCPPCTSFTCKELASPQSPPDNEAVCSYYNQDLCITNLCESP